MDILLVINHQLGRLRPRRLRKNKDSLRIVFVWLAVSATLDFAYVRLGRATTMQFDPSDLPYISIGK
jgi:hypothetical protein